jgi:hypothetical protein
MARLSDLVEAVAHAEGMDAATVALFARTVREAGLIRTGGRGLSAAKMNVSDAANLLIAVNASMSVRAAPETVRSFRELKGQYHTNSEAELPHLPRDKWGWVNLPSVQFGNVLEELLKCAAQRAASNFFLSLPLTETILEDFSKSTVEISIEFNKPVPVVSLSIFERNQRPTDPAAFSFLFSLPKRLSRKIRVHRGKVYPHDRTETTEIGYRTILAAADQIRDSA